jgi:deazaflavin-dependent oxidoreductase (nitroreductase family)
MTDFESSNRRVIDEFRAGRGVVGSDLQTRSLLLLHHIGARSGTERVTPLVYWPVSDASVAVLASNFGAPRHPGWYHNLIAHPTATIETSTETWNVRARIPDSRERDELIATMTQTPGVTNAIRQTSRQIPVVILDLTTRLDPNQNQSAIHSPH